MRSIHTTKFATRFARPSYNNKQQQQEPFPLDLLDHHSYKKIIILFYQI